MKISYLIFTLSLFVLILNTDFELISNTLKYIETLSPLNTFKFEIPAQYEKKAIFKVTTNKTSSSGIYDTLKITAFEYLSRDEEKGLISNTFSIFSNTNTFSKLYEINHSSTAYLAFQIQPSVEITSVYLKVIVNSTIIHKYLLFNNSKEYLGTLYPSDIYQFNIYSKNNRYINIEFTKNDTLSTNSQEIIAYEYDDYKNKTNLLKKQILILSYNSIKNSYSLSYNVNSSKTQLVSFEINPRYQMESTYVKVSIFLLYYDLYSGRSQFVGNLLTSKTYKFYVGAQYYNYVDIEFTKNDKLSTNSQYIDIYEYYTSSKYSDCRQVLASYKF